MTRRRRTRGSGVAVPGSVRTAADRARSALWPLPALLVTVAAIGGVLLPRWERGAAGDGLSPYVFGGGPDAARSVCSAIAGSVITVTSLTFSLTVVSLQLFSSQFSPRLLRSFASDRTVQVTLGMLLATFTYSLAVLRTIRSAQEGQPFVPAISVTVALLLALASVAALVLFLAHLVRQLRVETVMSSVAGDARATIHRVLPDADAAPAEAPVPPVGAVPVEARRTGFLLRVDEARLTAAAGSADVVVFLHPTPGDWMVYGTPIATVWSSTGNPPDRETLAALADGVDAALTVGPERTGVNDITIGMRQLADIAAKALSPGVNDPTTAVHALGHLSALLCELAGRDLAPRLGRDEADQVRAVIRQRQFPELLDLAVGQVRRCAARLSRPSCPGCSSCSARSAGGSGPTTRPPRSAARPGSS